MRAFDNSYSRFIAFAKVILPLVALGIMATLFLFQKSVSPNTTIPYSDVQISEIMREQRIGAPSYAGVAKDGTAISVRAKTAKPDPANSARVTAEFLSAMIEYPNGGSVSLASDAGSINSSTQKATMAGNVVVTTSTGFRIATQGLEFALGKTDVKTTSPITANSPFGTLEAGQMAIERNTQTNNHKVLRFTKGVKLIYTPK